MNKEIKKAFTLLDEKEKAKAAAIAKIEKELNETKAKQIELTAKLNAGETANDYIKTLAELRDYEAAITYFENKLKETRAQSLTDAEYNTITAAARSAFDTLKKEQGAAIKKEVEALNKLFDAYNNDIAELNKLLAQAAAVKGISNGLLLNAQEIAQSVPDIGAYTTAYYRDKTNRLLLKTHGVKV